MRKNEKNNTKNVVEEIQKKIIENMKKERIPNMNIQIINAVSGAIITPSSI